MNDDIKHIMNGRVVDNPNYSKSKKNKEPKYIRSYDDKDKFSYDDIVAKNLQPVDDKSYSLTELGDPDKYSKYGVTVNRANTIEELNRERASNQSAMEQTGHAVAQAVGNEIILGTALGLSNLYDFAANLGKDKGDDDYTNPLSTAIEEVQDKVRERFEIYTKDPGQTWAVGDFGWWASNSVSIASSASMMIPSVGIVKGASALGKIGRIGAKTSYGMAKLAKAAKLTNNVGTAAKAIGAGTEILGSAILSRTMEGYMEARDVYKQVYESSLDRISSMNDEDKQRLIERNPELAGKSNEEMASYMSSVSADETFKNDYAMLLMDVVQFKALGSLWKGMPTKNAGFKLKVANKKARMNLLGDTSEEAQKAFNRWKVKEYIKSGTLGAAGQWSEGIEEGYQGIQSNKGLEVAEKMFNPAFTAKTFGDYMEDPEIWEQAFWGVIGGVGFQAIGTGIGNLGNKVKGKIDKANMTTEDYLKSQQTELKLRQDEIAGRQAIMQEFNNNMNTLNAGKNPFDVVINPTTKQPLIEDGNEVLRDVSEEDKEVLKIKLINKLASDMVFNATEAGNYELLREFITDPNFNKFFEEAGVTSDAFDKDLTSTLINKMDSLYESYSKTLYDIMRSIDVNNEGIAKMMGRSIARRESSIQDINTLIGEVQTLIDADSKDYSDYSTYEQDYYNQYVSNLLFRLDASDAKNKARLDAHKISKSAYNAYKEQSDIRRNQLLDFVADNTGFGNIEAVRETLSKSYGDRNVNEFINSFNEFVVQFDTNKQYTQGAPKKSYTELIGRKIELQDEAHYVQRSLPKTQEDFTREYNELASVMDNLVIKKHDEAIAKIGEWIEEQPNLEDAYNSIMEGNVPELKDEIDMLKLGHESTARYKMELDVTVNQIFKDRAKAEADAKKASSDGNNTNEKTAKEINDELNSNIPSSTGTVVQSETTGTTNTITNDSPIINEASENLDYKDGQLIAVPVEGIDNTITDLDSNFETVMEEDALTYRDPNKTADIKAISLTRKVFRESPHLFTNIEGKDDTSSAFNELVEEIETMLIDEGVSRGVARQAAIKGLKANLRIINGGKNKNKFNTLADILTNKAVVETNVDDTSLSTIREIQGDEFNKVVDDFIESYIEKKGIAVSENNKTVIDIVDLFNELMINEDIGYEQAKYIFRNIAGYIANNRSNKYSFNNINILKDNIDNPDSFFQSLMVHKQIKVNLKEQMHVPLPSQDKDKAIDAIKSLNHGDEVNVTTNGNSLSFRVNGVEVGYLARVKVSDDGTSYSQTKQVRGFVRTITRTPDGDYTDVFDNLFNSTIRRVKEGDFDKLHDIVNTYYQQSQAQKNGWIGVQGVTEDMAKVVLNNKAIKDLMNRGLILIPKYINGDLARARYILNEMSNVINYDNNAITEQEVLDSYRDWKISIFDNYAQTYEMQKAVDAGEKVRVAVSSLKEGDVIIDKDGNNVADIGLDHKKNPIAIVDSEGSIRVEGSDRIYTNRGMFDSGTMGMVVRDNQDAPVLALFSEPNNISNSPELKKNVTKELTSLFESFYNEDISFDELYIALSNLMGGPGVSTNNLFRGYSVVMTGDKNVFALNIGGNKGSYNLTVYRNKKGKDVTGTGIVYTPNGDKSKGVTSIKYNKKLIDSIVTEIVDNLVFNKTFFAVNNNTEANNSDNKYLRKENGKIVVEIGGVRNEYDNFGQFVLDNNAFKTTQGVDETGSFFEDTKSSNSMYVNPKIIKAPEATTTEDGIRKLLNKETKDEPVSTKEVLEAAGVEAEKIDILMGSNEAEIALVPENVLYDPVTTKAVGRHSKGKVYITNGGVKAISNSSTEAVRVIVHENLHRLFQEKNVFAREGLVNDLYDTYNKFVEAINNDINNKDSANHEVAKLLKSRLLDKNFSLEGYGKSLSVSNRKIWDARTEDERKQKFAEEWLIESITQPALINYLNNTMYGDVQVADNANKTIWQKIIDVLLKLFGKSSDVIKNNTILAKQYSLLGDTTTETNVVTEVVETETKEDITPTEQTEDIEDVDELSPFQESIIEDVEDSVDSVDDFNPFDDPFGSMLDDFSTIPLIESNDNYTDTFMNNNEYSPTGISIVNDMNSYLKRFNPKDRDGIKKMIEDNDIKFNCGL